MSQKRLKKLRREEKNESKEEVVKSLGIRQIIKKNWKFLFFLLLGTIVLYLNSLRGDFVSDDYATISQNPLVTNFKNALTGWMSGLITWVLAVIFGVNSSIPFHITSLFLYLIVLVMAFVLVEIVFNNNLVSKISTVIFAVLPVHVEAVSWIAGRPYLLNALFVLLSLSLFILFLKTEKKRYLYWFLVFGFLTFAAEKTRSTALLVLLFLYWVTFDNKLKKKLPTKKIILVLLMVFGVVILVLWPSLRERIVSVNSGTNASESIFYNPFVQYPTSIPKYLQLILVPTDLTLYHTMYVNPVWLNWLVFLTYISCLVLFWFKDKKIFFVLAFVFAAAAPSMAPVKISWLVAERYVFLGSLGIAMLLGFYFDKLWQKNKIISLILLSFLVSIYSVRVYLRNIDWQTNHNLWVSACQVSPNSHNAWNNIGDDYDKLAQLEKTEEGKMKQYLNAVKGFSQSTVIKPNYADAYHNQANILYKMGRIDLARTVYETALQYNPNLYQTYITLIQLDLLENNKEQLLKHLAVLQKVRQNDLQVAYLTAMAYARIGMIDEAKELSTMMYQQFPNVPEIKNLYNSLNQSGVGLTFGN